MSSIHKPPSTSFLNGCPREPRREVDVSREELLSPDDPTEGFFSTEEWNAIGRALELSRREMAVTVLLARGVSRQGIASHLHKADGSCLSADTVRVYIDRVFRKARVTDRVSLTMRLARVYVLLRGAGPRVQGNGQSQGVGAEGRTGM
jgi:ATP/maltotriose-dependent transcriptional regulator MalT